MSDHQNFEFYLTRKFLEWNLLLKKYKLETFFISGWNIPL